MARQEQLNLDWKGLQTDPNTFSKVPPGSMTQAQNVVISRFGLASLRRGFAQRYDPIASATAILSLGEYFLTPILHANDNKLYYDDGTAWTAFGGTYVVPDNTDQTSRVRFATANNNLYFNTSKGIYKLDSFANDPVLAGMSPALGGTAATSGTDGFLYNNSNVAYRIVWGYVDANGNLILGAPSSRIIIGQSTSGYQEVTFTSPIASGDSTGLTNDATVYNATLNINGGSSAGGATVALAVTGSTAQLYSDLISQIESQVASAAPGNTVTVSIVSGSLRITSDSTLVGSAVSIVDGPSPNLFSSLTNYSAISTAVGSTTNTTVTFQIPDTITTGDTYYVYRSDQSATVSTAPNDNCYLVYEGNPTAGEITAKSITITDIVPDSNRGAALYTDANQLGIAAANYQPPYCADMCLHRGYMFYANTQTLQTFFVNLVNVGSPTGIQVGDTITVTETGGSTFTLTGDTVENTSTGHFQVYTSGSASINLQNTAQSIERVINAYASNDFCYCYYISDFGTNPGQMFLQARQLGQPTFYITCSRTGNVFSPNLPSSGSTVTNTSTNDTKQNRLYYSSYQQPESVPVLNYYDVGSQEYPILRILSVRDYLYIFKTDGIYYIAGLDSGSFSVFNLSTTCFVDAPNSAVSFNDEVFVSSNLGVVSVSLNGVRQISIPIKTTLQELSSDLYPYYAGATWGCAYNSDRKYILGTVTNTGDEWATQCFVYDVLTQTWTQWDRAFTCAYVPHIDNKMIAGSYAASGGAQSYKERKDFALTDYADEQYAVNIVSSSSLDVVLTDTSQVAVNQTIVQGTLTAVVTAVDYMTDTVTVDTDNPWAAGAATVYNPISATMTTTPIYGNAPSWLKHWMDCNIFFQQTQFTTLGINFISDLLLNAQQGTASITIEPNTFGSYGLDTYGGDIYGGVVTSTTRQQRLHLFVPRLASRSNWLQIQINLTACFSNFDCAGVELSYTQTSRRQR